MARRLQLTLAVVLLAAQCLSATWRILAYQTPNDDTGEAVRLARVCIEQGECRAMGTHTSMLGLNHGASWIRLLAHCLDGGGGLQTAQLIVLACLMVASLVSFLVIWRFVPGPAALLALLLSLQPTIGTADFIKLANSNLLPFPLALYYAATAVCVARGSVAASVIGGIFLATAASANLTCMLLVPFHIGLVGLFARRPVAAAAASLMALVTTFALESYDAAHTAAQLMLSAPFALGVLAALAALLALASFFGGPALSPQQLRDRVASLPPRLRLRAVMKAALVYISVVLWVGSAALSWSPGHYLAPLVFPLSFLAADAAEQLSKRAIIALSATGVVALILFPFAPLAFPLVDLLMMLFSGVVAVATPIWAIRRRIVPFLGRDPLAAAPALTFFLAGVALAASLPDTILIPRERQAWTVAAAEDVTTALYESGYTFPQLLASLQQHEPGTIDIMMGMLDPNFFDPPPPAVDTGWSLLALIVDSPSVARTTDVVLTVPVNASRSAIVVRAPSYLDRTHVRTCYLSACGERSVAEACTERQPEQPISHVPPFFRVDKAEDRSPGELFSYQPEGGKYCIVFSSPLHTSGTRVPHIIRVASDRWPLEARITRVSGVDYEGHLPGAEVRLTDAHEATGTLEVEVSSNGIGPGADWLADPPIMEVTAANEHLLEPYRNGRASRW